MAENIGLRAVMEMEDFNRGVDRYLREIDRMNSQTTGFAGSMIAQWQTLGQIAVGTAVTLTTAVGVAAGLAVAKTQDFLETAVGEAMQLQDQLAGIAAVLGQTVDDIAPLQEAIEELAIDPNLKVTTFEAAEAMEILARNGLEVEQILGGAAKATIALANATGGTFEKSAAVATDALNIFGANIEDVGNFVGQVTAVVNRSKFDLQDYQYALSNAGAVAQTLGLSFEEFNAGIIGISSAFNSGRRAGTSFTNFLVNMVPKSKQAAQVMAAIGLVTEQGNLAFFDAQGKFLGLENAAQVLQNTFGKMSEAERDFFIRQVFGIEALESVIELMKLGADGVKKVKEEMAEVDAFKAVETRMKTLAGAIEVLNGIFEAMRIRFATKMLPGLERGVRALNVTLEENYKNFGKLGDAMGFLIDKAVDALIPLAQKWIPLLIDASVQVSEWIVRWIETGEMFNDKFGAMPKVIQNAVEFTVRFSASLRTAVNRTLEFIEVLSRALRPLTDWIKQNITLEDVMIGLGIAVASFFAPLLIGLAKLSTAALILFAAISRIRVAWETNWAGIREFTAEAVERIIRIVKLLWHILVEDLLGMFGDDAFNLFTKAFIILEKVILRILDIVEKLLIALDHLIHGRYREAWEVFSQIWIDLFKDLGLDKVWNRIKNFIDDLIVKFKKIDWTGVWESILTAAKDIFSKVSDFLKPYLMKALAVVQDVFNRAKAFIEKVLEQIIETWQRIWARIKPIIDQIVEWVKDAWEKIWNFIKNFSWEDIWNRVKELTQAAWNRVKELTQEAWEWIKNKVIEKYNEIVNWIENTPVYKAVEEQFNRITAFLEKLGLTWGDVFLALGLAFSATFGIIAGILDSTLVKFLGWFALFLTGIALFRLAWENNFGGIREFTAEVLDRINIIIEKAVAVGTEFWRKYGDDIIGFVYVAFTKVQPIILGILDAISHLIDVVGNLIEGDWAGAWGSFQAAVMAVWEPIRDVIVDILEEVKKITPEFVDKVINVIIAILNGDWQTAWSGAKEIVLTVWEVIKSEAERVWGIIYNIITQTLDDSLSEFLGWDVQIRDLMAGIALYFTAKPIMDFVAELAKAKFQILVLAAGIALFRTGWEQDWAGMRTFFTQVWEDIKVPVVDIIENLLGGRWELAWDGAKVVVGIVKGDIIAKLQEIGKWFTDTFPSTVAVWGEIWNSLGNAAKGGFDKTFGVVMDLDDRLRILDLRIANIGLGFQRIAAGFTGQGDKALFDQQQKNLAEIDRIWSEYQSRVTVAQQKIIDEQIKVITSAAAPFGVAGNTAGKAAFDRMLAAMSDFEKIDYAIESLRGNIGNQLLSLQEIFAMAGRDSMQGLISEFDSFDNPGSPTYASIYRFIEKTELLANLIKAGFADAGSESVKLYIEGLVAQSGALEQPATDLAYKIIEAISGQDRFFLSAGEETVKSLASGFTSPTSIDTVNTAWQSVFDLANKYQIELPADMYVAGLESATQLGLGASEGSISAIDAYTYVMAQIEAKLGELPPEAAQTGVDSTTALGTGITTGAASPISSTWSLVSSLLGIGGELPPEYATYGMNMTTGLGEMIAGSMGLPVGSTTEMVNKILGTGANLPTGFAGYGTALVDTLNNEILFTTNKPVSSVQEMIRLMLNEGATLPPGFKDFGALSIENVGIGAESEKQPTVDVFTGIGESLKDPYVQAHDAWLGIGRDLVGWIRDGMDEGANNLILNSTLETITKKTFEPLFEVFPQNGTNLIENMALGMDQGTHFVDDFLVKLMAGTLDPWWADTIQFFNDRGQQAMAEATAGLITQQPKFIQVFTDLKAFVTDWFNGTPGGIVPFFNDRGQQSMAELTAGLMAQRGKVTGFLEDLRTTIVQIAKDTADKFVSAFDGITEKVAAKFAGLFGAVQSQVNPDQFRSIGENIGQSFVSGVESKVGAAQTAVNNLVNLAAQAATTAAQIASPSKVFMRIGELSGEGYVVGWKNMMGRIQDTVTSVVSGSAHRLTPAAPAMAGATTNNYNYRTNQIAPNFDIAVRDERDAHRLTQIIRKVINESL